jgi:hypothetical protein
MFVCIKNFINFAPITNYISTMLNKILITITLLCSPILISAQNIFETSPDYIAAGQSSQDLFYINTKTIAKDSIGYRVCLGIYSYNSSAKKSHKHKKLPQRLYSLEYNVFDLDGSRSKMVSFVDYDSGGNVVSQYNCDNPYWSRTTPGSVFEFVANVLKEYISKNPIVQLPK